MKRQTIFVALQPILGRRLASGSLAFLALLALLLTPSVRGDGDGLLETPEPAGAHALTGIRLVPAPGRVIENATLVLRDGIVEAAGAGVEIPPGARVWDRSGKTVYPGLIESHLARPWPPGLGPGEAGHPDPRVHPERHLGDHDLLPELVTALRQAGFTAALAVPADGIFRGQSALLSLGEGGVRSNLLIPHVALHLGMEPRGRQGEGYGISAMGVAHLLRQTFLDARWYAAARATWENDGGPRPLYDASLDALTAAATGAQPVVFEAREPLELLRAGRLAAELGLDAWILGTGREYQLLGQVQALDRPLLLPLDFPEAPKAKKGDDLAVGLEELRHWEAAPNNPLALLQGGVTVAFTSHRLDVPGDLHEKLHEAIQRGLTEEQALAALTTVPARLLGAERLLGTLEAGKVASFVVVDGSLFNGDPQIIEVWVDGRRYESPGASPPEADARGEWRLRLLVDEEGGETLRLVLEGEAEDLRGEVRTKEASVPLLSARVSGTTLEVVYSGDAVGFAGAVTLELELRGDDARGLGRGPEGEFAVQGRRVKEAPPDESNPGDEAPEVDPGPELDSVQGRFDGFGGGCHDGFDHDGFRHSGFRYGGGDQDGVRTSADRDGAKAPRWQWKPAEAGSETRLSDPCQGHFPCGESAAVSEHGAQHCPSLRPEHRAQSYPAGSIVGIAIDFPMAARAHADYREEQG